MPLIVLFFACDKAKAPTSPESNTTTTPVDEPTDTTTPVPTFEGDRAAESADIFIHATEPWYDTQLSLLVEDLDGDDVPELVIGAWETWATAPVAGAVYVVDTPLSGDVNVDRAPTIFGVGRQARTGSALAAQDLDNDGVTDLVIGSAGFVPFGPGATSGAVYLFAASGLDGRLTTAEATITLLPPGEPDSIGFDLEIADLDGDGIDDLAIGAPDGQPLGLRAQGAIYLVQGPLSKSTLIDPSWLVTSRDSERYIGWAFCTGDFDADGHADLLVGDWAGTPTGAAILRGPIDGVTLVENAWDRLDAPGDDLAGHSVECADVDGDGLSDAQVGAPWESANAEMAGAAYLSYGPVVGHQQLGEHAFYANDRFNYVGFSMATGQIDDDEPIFAVGAPRTGNGGTDCCAGVIHLFDGVRDADSLEDATGRVLGGDNMGLGASVLFGDLTGDQRDELISPVYTADRGYGVMAFSASLPE